MSLPERESPVSFRFLGSSLCWKIKKRRTLCVTRLSGQVICRCAARVGVRVGSSATSGGWRRPWTQPICSASHSGAEHPPYLLFFVCVCVFVSISRLHFCLRITVTPAASWGSDVSKCTSLTGTHVSPSCVRVSMLRSNILSPLVVRAIYMLTSLRWSR